MSNKTLAEEQPSNCWIPEQKIVRFKDLSRPLKAAIIASWLIGGFIAFLLIGYGVGELFILIGKIMGG